MQKKKKPSVRRMESHSGRTHKKCWYCTFEGPRASQLREVSVGSYLSHCLRNYVVLFVYFFVSLNVIKFKYLGTTVTSQNYIHKGTIRFVNLLCPRFLS